MARGIQAASIAGVTLWTALATAQPSSTDKATADALFRAGKDLLDAGKVAEACPKLAESQRIDPRTGTLLNLASCHEQEGKTASAWAEFNEAAAQAANAKQVEREKFARGKVDELEKVLSKLKIVVGADAPGLEVKIDGKGLRSVVIGTPIPLDPGPHTVEATAPVRTPWSRSVVLGKGPVVETIEIPALAEIASDATPVSPAPAPSPPPPTSKVWPATGLALFGAGSMALGAGVFFGLDTLSKRDDAEAQCAGDLCTQAGLDKYDEARGSATISTLMIGLGLAAVAAGVYLVFLPPSRAKTSWRFAPGRVAGQW